MSEPRNDVVDALRATLKERDRLRKENQRLLDAGTEPIAIVGMACRYPGIGSPAGLWDLVSEGRDGISPFPDDRGWDLEGIYDPDPDTPGTCYTREAGFLTDAADFDAEFFGISPREAVAMDPQQRLLLEACWETLEDAGIDPASLRGEPAGVFAGVSSGAYTAAIRVEEEGLEGYHLTGTTTSIVSGRVAYALGLEGPAISIDTACSSSLVAMHLASQALRGGECNLALAGGTTVFATPGIFLEFSRQRGLSPDGRSKSFADAADGVAFAEGVGMLLLERLSDAQRNGHEILAVLRGSATNQDGASNGLTAPNGPSQERVIRQALANAGLSPEEVDAVEAHGTGTTLGDPIEAQALLATYGQDREEPLKLGSIKSNIGHTQAAAGVAGVIKMVMAMREGALPATLHVDEPSSHVDWTAGKVELLTEAQPWEPNGRPRRAGVSSFGISGTNAHVILEEAPDPDLAGDGGPGASSEDSDAAAPLGALPLVLSAKSEAALAEAASRLATYLRENSDVDLADIAYSLATTRSALEQRAVVTASDRKEALAALAALADGTSAPNLTTATAQPGRTAFLLTGQGAQRAGMGSELYESFPAYAKALDEVIVELDKHTDRPMKELIFSEPDSDEATLLDHTTYAQPALFATEIAIYRLLESFGVTPDLLTGHSIGEIAAAHLSGVFSLEDSAKLVAARGALMGALPDGGAMLAIGASEEEVAKTLEGKEKDLSIATINGPTSIVISGTEKAIEELQKLWDEKGAKTKRLTVSHAFHSPLMEPMLEEFSEVAESLSYSDPRIPIVSNRSGEILSAEEATDPAYWVSHVREPVRFADAVKTLSSQGATRLIEVGPDAVLTAMARECLAEADQQPAFVATMRRDHAEPETFTGALAGAHASGADLDWKAIFAGRDAKRVSLPTYPFQRKRYWIDSTVGSGDLAAAGQSSVGHPMLGATVELAEGRGTLLTARLSLKTQPWLADHAVAGTVLLPGTAFVELALRAGGRAGTPHLRELTLQAPLVIPEDEALQLQIVLAEPGEDGAREIAIHSRPEVGPDEGPSGAPDWTCHAEGLLASADAATPESLTEWPPADTEPIDVEFLYDQLAEIGLEYGPAFQGLTAAWRDGEAIYAEVSLAEAQRESAARFGIHPALLDAALHSATLGSAGAEPRLPFSWNDVSLYGTGADSLRVRLEAGEDSISLTAFDQDGTPLAEVGSLAVRPISADALQGAKRRSESLYGVEWNEIPLEETTEAIVEEEGTALEVREAAIPGTSDSAAAALDATQSTLEMVQAWLADEANDGSRLALLTEGAVAAEDGESPDPAAAALWGLLRSAQSEHPERFVLLDTDGAEASAKVLDAALATEEPQLALRDGVALVPRVAPAVDRPDSLLPPAGPWQLGSTKRGTLEGLALVPNPGAAEPLGPTEVRIAVRAAGLNFRDVLIALGQYPGEASIGSEGAGVVVEVGSEVDDLAPGDRVMGTIPDAFAPLARTDRPLLARVPEGWSFEQAAAVPAVFVTAHYALTDLANLKKGEKILVHAGAGGVGMAAIQIANHLGAEVFATASPAKWDALRELGLDDDHLSSSRDLDFKEKFGARAGEGGLDVVLNSLAGEFIDASLDLLGEGGRFVEMGKADVRDPDGMAAGVSYRAFDLTDAGAEEMGEMLAGILDLFERGALRHSPISTWDIRRAQVAFRHLREGRNIGKVVLTLPRGIDPERTVLVTGGTGALGTIVARHLVAEHGARHLLLTSRSGEKAEGAEELKAGLEELGATVKIAACDAADRKALKALLGKLPKAHPLGAVVHAAGTLDDATVEALTPEQVEAVFAPKVDAAWNLHELTADGDLSAFVTFSSASGTIGGPGQANYAAANVFLDALAQRRRAEGHAATSIAWGLWAGTGMAGGVSDTDLERMARTGVEAISVEQGLGLLDAALGADRALALGVRLNPAGLRGMASAGALPPILSGLVRAPTRRPGGAALAAKLAGLSEDDQERLVLELVRTEIAAVLGHSSSESIAPQAAFKDLGFDSLAAVELRNRLNSASGLRLAATTVFDYPNPEKLAGYLRTQVTAGGAVKRVAVRAQASDEPIAIVGMACRYPGEATSPQGLWRLVSEGRDGISEFPGDRGWDLDRLYNPDPDNPGTSYVREGGFLADVGDFDAEFFGISPREAVAMDPQQRLLLEACWEALEDASIDPVSLRGEPAGVFAGVSSGSYATGSGKELEGYRLTGTTTSVASGRVAYTLGLEGPAISVDTACSSSLVAMHLAAQALRSGECTLALAGGSTVLATPGLFTEFSRQRGLAPDGRSKSFAEAADGVAWSEGAGVLLLERLSDAERNGHRVLATMRGSATNQDGASNGLTAPNGPSQERVIHQALANARLTPQEVDAVEAHGTGTTLGDPIEAQALLATYGQDREEPLRLGSIKSNIGHSATAAGVAGVIKMVMAMREGVLPPTLHVDEPTSHVDWSAGKVELLTEAQPWEPNGRPRRAGVSSFGISGTNAHVILEEAPVSDRGAGAPTDSDSSSKDFEAAALAQLPLVLSAKSEAALAEAASRLAAHLKENGDVDLVDVAYSLATTRAALEQRAVMTASDRKEALSALASLAAGDSAPNLTTATAQQGRTAFLLTGQGAQRAGMGSELYESFPAYAKALDEVIAELDKHTDRPIKELIFSEPGSAEATLLDHTTYAQPALFATEIAIYRLLESFGITPDLLTGHSIGEIAAAHLSGVFSLEDASKLVAARGALMGALPDGGAMLAIGASEEEVAKTLEGKEKDLSIATINGPTSIVISGDAKAIEAAQAEWDEKGAKTKRLTVSHAFHSPLMEPMLEEFSEVAESLSYSDPKIPIVSNRSGEILSAEDATDPAYWVSHVREPVRFADAVTTLSSQGATRLIEVGPDAVLTAMARECLADSDQQPAFVATMRREHSEEETFASALAGALASGADLDWKAIFAGADTKRVSLPTYPFQRKRYWTDSVADQGDISAAGLGDARHPLLGAAIESPHDGSLSFSGRLSLQTHPWLADHAVAGTVLLPGTAFVELALHAGERGGTPGLEELTLQAPLILPETGALQLQLTLAEPGEDGMRRLTIHSRPEVGEDSEASEWTRHAEGLLGAAVPSAPEPLAEWPPAGGESVDVEFLYDQLAEAGLDYGPAFQGLTAAWRDGEAIYAEVGLAEDQRSSATDFGIHPALLDAALHSATLEAEAEPRLPFSWNEVSLYGTGADSLRVRLEAGEDSIALVVFDEEGAPLVAVGSLALRPVSSEALKGAKRRSESLYGIEWAEVDLDDGVATDEDRASGVDVRQADVTESADVAAAALDATRDTLEMVQAWLADEDNAGSRLALLTSGAVAANGGESPDPAAAALWGLLRSAQSEHPGRFALVDTDGTEASAAALDGALAAGEEEPQLALREGVALAPRVAPAQDRPDSLLPPAGPWHLTSAKPGSLDGLALVTNPAAVEPLGPTEVRIAVRAAGLNFRDVLIALGQYPGEAQVGSEGAGVVVEVGAEVEDLGPGDRVTGMIPVAFAPLAVTERRLVAAVPKDWSFEGAAAVPTVFMTARYGLGDLADLRKGEKVLIHAGAGGVGMAAIQIAQHLGAEVFATASPSKWDALRELGLDDDHIASSRDLEFKEKFLAITGGEGVDVVLNALAGEFIDASLDLLGEGGRFVEMGKADVRDPERVGEERPGVSYRAFDLVEAGPERMGEMLAEVLDLLAAGTLRQSPISTWDMRQAPEAFRHLREGGNVGKVVLTLPRGIAPEKTVLVTGGTGALGSLVARHLVAEHGARNLLLTSRSGAKAEGAKELKAELEELGAKVKIAACDAADREALKALLEKLPKSHPLGAVVHAAGTIDDGTVETLTTEQLETVFAPKATAAWNLHELSRDEDLSAFVTFSSISGTVGGPGQANYAAANVFLDALAQRREAEGLPATSIAWGLWAGAGMGGDLSETDLARMGRTGIDAISVEQGLALLDAALGADRSLAIGVRLNPAGLRGMAAAGALPPILNGLVRAPTRRAGSGALAAKLAGLPEAEQERYVLELVRGEIAAVLGHASAEEVPAQGAFKDLGFDSLAAVELRNRLNVATGLRLAATTVFDYPNPEKLAGYVVGEVTAGGAAKRVAVKAQSSDEPIAIVGMACRYPGEIGSPDQLWRLVVEGRNGIAGFPEDRGWDLDRLYDPDPENSRTSYVRAGGFVYDAGEFDAEFFGISPREALAMDPQQRLLLEACWEALEDAGIDPISLRGESAGVFAGVSSGGYTASSNDEGEGLEGYHLTGTTTSVVSGRVSYTLGLEGPAISVDTACSSSLVAMHLATQALRGGECSLALAGGTTVMATPGLFTEFSRQRALAPDGRCKSFAEAADGVGWSEGTGVVLLERLSDAERNGHSILAVMRGSATNQDGASNGLTAPNGPSQERVMRQALANAGLTPQEVDAVEAHGTGTMLGDPIEAQALLATYGQERDVPLKLGSIKSNLGHSVAAAGVAGVIKMVMAMREGTLPPTLHVDEPTSHVDWSAGEVELLTEAEPWEADGRPRRAAVSSFGISGTNAHVILEEAPEGAAAPRGSASRDAKTAPLPDLRPLVLSAKTEPALREAAERLSTHLKENPDLDLTDLAFSLATSRASLEQRAVITASDPKEVLSALSALAEGSPNEDLITATARTERGPAFLFAGQGAQHPQMALELLEASPAFATHIEACEKALSPHVDWSLTEILREEDGKWMDRLDIVQPALFAVMVSLAKLWMDLGVKPSVVAGHSQGEIAAAHISGALSLEDAAKVIALRAKAMTKLAGKGGMLSVSLPTEKIDSLIEPYGDRVSLAATNGPASQVLSGEPDALEEILKSCESDGIRAQKIAVDYAAHSAQIEDLEAELLEAFSEISPKPSQIPFHSTVTGEVIDTTELDASYWYRNLRQTVQMEPVLRSLLNQGQRCFIEIGPHPVLGFGLQETIDDVLADNDATVIATLRRGEGGPKRFAHSLAQAHAAGAELDWEAVFAGSDARRVGLPTYPFQRRHFWSESTAGAGDVSSVGLTDLSHPLLGAAIESPRDGSLSFAGRLSVKAQPWLADHAVAGTVLLPGTAFVELALHAGERAGVPHLGELTLHAPLVLPRDGALQLQLTLAEPGEDGMRPLEIHSRLEEGGEDELSEAREWTRHAEGLLGPAESATPEPLGEWPPSGTEPIEVEFLYESLAEAGLEYGPAFQGLTAAWRNAEAIYAEVSLAEGQRDSAARFGVHPALLDAALHSAALDGANVEGGGPSLPFSWSGVSLHGSGADSLRVRLAPGEGALSLTVFDQSGAPLAAVDSLALRPISADQLAGAKRRLESLYGIEWDEVALASEVGDDGDGEAALVYEPEIPTGSDPAAAAMEATKATLEAVQAWLADEDNEQSRFALLTRGAVAAGEGESPDPVAASLWGLLRSAQTEHPGRFALIDTDGSDASLAALDSALATAEEEPQLALREGVALAPRVIRAAERSEEETDELAVALDPEKTVLIVGGTGTLGALVARHLVTEHGARHLLLTSRSGERAQGARELRAGLEELGATATIAACDTADRNALKALLEEISDEHPLGAVIHAAGALADGTVDALSAEDVETVFVPKAGAAWNLHELTKDLDLSAFLVFSSIAGSLGGPAQANYAAANVFCDALAEQRRSEGLPAASIAWGLWAQASAMTGHLSEADLSRMARTGFEALSNEQGLALFDAALRADLPLALAVRLNWGGLRTQAQAGALPTVFRGLVRTPARRPGGEALAAKLAGLSEAEQERVVLEMVRGEIAAVLGHDSAEAIPAGGAFKDLGFDSLAAVELRNRLNVATGLRLAATTVFDYPNPEKLAGYLRAQVTAGSGAAKVAVRAQSSDEPIAIVGMACRYPGEANSPAGLWELVTERRDGISDFPTDRGWDLDRTYNAEYTREGGFLYDVADFDAGFFGISPRDAVGMDPQQRLLLEACWEALEDAGIDPASLRGEPAGVFAGVMTQDYGFITGMTSSIIPGRVAYTLGLEGPALTVDTACSSSLVAIHLAAQALRGGECSLALTGGVTVLSTPNTFVGMGMQDGLAPNGRSKSFADAADGAGFSEGVGMLLMERLSDAERNGHEVLAVLRGSATNQDGASNGLTAPNGPSQERVIRQALANARLTPQDVDAVEAHGTGTSLGDPIEAGALLATYGQDREEPLKLGAVKSNIGHTQAAAGVAGVIKMVMAMREGALPATLHVDEPSSHVDWTAGKVELLTEAQPWEPNGRPRRAGVSSFGISGTNAHVILEEAPDPDLAGDGGPGASSEDSDAAAPLGALPLVLSAKSEAALAEAASRLATYLRENSDVDLADIAYSLATTRSALEQRAVVTASDRKEALAALAALADGTSAPNLTTATAQPGRTAFLLTGQGAQRAGMGSELYESFPAYAKALDEVIVELDKHTDRPMKELIFSEPDSDEATLLDHTTYAQPALFATEIAIYRLLESFGVTPDLLTGHSIGEIAAAHLSGVFSLEDSAKLVAARGALMGALPDGGAMLAIGASEEEVAKTLEGKEKDLSIATINGPTSIVISGTEKAIEELQKLWDEKGAKTKRLTVSHAFHSPLMEPMLEEFSEVAESLSYSDPRIPIVSNRSGEILSAEEATDPAYWVSHVREPVRFADAVTTLSSQGATRLIEVGPDAVLTAMARECLAEADQQPAFVATMRRDHAEPETFTGALAGAHASGADLDWKAIFAGADTKRVSLPTYPFQRKRYWMDATNGSGDLTAAGQAPAGHPLLGAAVELAGAAGQSTLFTSRLSLRTQPWLADHAVAGTVLLPGTAFVELALHAGGRAGTPHLRELTLQAPLVIPEDGAMQLQLTLAEPDEDGMRQLAIHSRPELGADEDPSEAAEWSSHAEGLLSAAEVPAPDSLTEWPPAAAKPIDVEYLYDTLVEAGLEYGPVFQGVTAAWRNGEAIYTEVALGEEQREAAAHFGIHPALLDAALHGAFLAQPDGEAGDPHLPFAWNEVSLHAGGGAALRVCLETGEDSISLAVFDQGGMPLVEVGSLVTRPVSAEQLQGAKRRQESLYGIDWAEVSLEGEPEGIAVLGETEIAGAERFADIAALAAFVAEGELAPQVVLFEPTVPDGTDPAVAALEITRATLDVVQEWIAEDALATSRLALLTCGAVATDGAGAPDPATASLWGLLRSAQSEHPGRFALIDTDRSEASAGLLVAALAAEEEPQLALREGVASAPRMVRLAAEAEEGSEPAVVIDPGKTALVTGATGALGTLVARHLVEAHGARHLLLVSRSGAKAANADELVAELRELGAEVEIAACDIADREALEALFGGVSSEHPLGAVVHTAGVIDDATIESLTGEQVETVFAPKVDAAWNLHELTKSMDLSTFVTFSSAAGTLGGPGQANYAAANVFLDSLAAQRRHDGLPASSIAWGLWAQASGMTGNLGEADLKRMARTGVEALTAEQGLALFDAALDSDRPLTLAMRLNSAGLRNMASAGALPPIFAGLVRIPAKRPGGAALAAKLAGLSEVEREGVVLELVRTEIAAVLGHSSGAEVPAQGPFKDLGFDSLAAVELRNRMNLATGLRLAATTVFDYPNPQKLAEYVVKEVVPADSADAGGEGAVEAELNRIESLLPGVESEDQRERIAARLRALLAGIQDGGAEDLSEATDEEMFELLDQELEQL